MRKKIRLTGKKLAQLNQLLHDRDKGCVMCGLWVDPGEKFHHVTFRSQGGGDTEQNGVILCRACHGLAHGANAKGIRERLKRYLEALYG
jgi:5-methylcytosine-specific restriction endonuclease McrA